MKGHTERHVAVATAQRLEDRESFVRRARLPARPGSIARPPEGQSLEFLAVRDPAGLRQPAARAFRPPPNLLAGRHQRHARDSGSSNTDVLGQ